MARDEDSNQQGFAVWYNVAGVGQASAVAACGGRGKSELHRARRWVTPRRGDPTESGTETYRPPIGGQG